MSFSYLGELWGSLGSLLIMYHLKILFETDLSNMLDAAGS